MTIDDDIPYGQITLYAVLTMLFLVWPMLILHYIMGYDQDTAAKLCCQYYTLPILLGIYLWAVITAK